MQFRPDFKNLNLIIHRAAVVTSGPSGPFCRFAKGFSPIRPSLSTTSNLFTIFCQQRAAEIVKDCGSNHEAAMNVRDNEEKAVVSGRSVHACEMDYSSRISIASLHHISHSHQACRWRRLDDIKRAAVFRLSLELPVLVCGRW